MEREQECQYCRWAREEMDWNYCPECGLPCDPLKAFKQTDPPTITDKMRIDWMEKMMTPDERFCEIYLAGLRDFTSGKATAFQIESNPDLIKYQSAPTLREAIDLAMTTDLITPKEHNHG